MELQGAFHGLLNILLQHCLWEYKRRTAEILYIINSMCFCILVFAFQIQAGLTCDDEFNDDSLNSVTAFKPVFMGT